MVKVYFESKAHAELIEIFEDEAAYMKALPFLISEAKKAGGYITESIIEIRMKKP